MKNSLLKGLLVFLTMFFTGFAYSQTVTGVVSDSSGPLAGASVTVKGTSNSQQTDLEGKFTIKNVAADAVLVFSYIGLKTEEVKVAGKSTINTTLNEDQEVLKEVMVIGYGSVKKKDATGAIDQLNSKSMDNISATSPAELLRGKVAGVQVTSSSGEPGAAASIRIRGNSSIRSGNGPLIVVDGVPLDGGNVSSGGDDLLGRSSSRNPLNFVNQNDIESMTILKDASSTAIYGSRGANGVIVITTKKGKSKEPQLTYSTSTQFSKIGGDFNVMGAQEFVDNGGVDNGSRVYNWKDAVLQNGLTTSHDLSYSKSTDNSSTRVSFGANNTEGIVKNTGLDKYTASLYNSNDFFDGKLKIEARLTYAGLKDRATLVTNNAGFIGNVIGTALYWNPTNPIYDASPDGYYNPGYNSPVGAYGSDTYLNPVQLLDAYKDYTNTSKLLGSINTTVKLTSNLKYQFLFGVETSNSARKSQLLPTIQVQGAIFQATDPVTLEVKRGNAAILNESKFNKTFEHTLSYNKNFSENVIFDALVGYSYYVYNADGNTARGRGYDIEQVNLVDNIEGGLQNEYRTTSFRNRVELQSYYGRTNFTLYKKLLITATLRADGATKLGANNKYDYFPSVGLGYKVVENKEGILNSFKLRGSYGITGNQEFSPNSGLNKAQYSLNGNLATDTNRNLNLKWETTKSSGVGADFTLLKNKLSGSLDYFMRDTKNLISPVPPAGSQPGPPSPRFVNLPGNLINKGFEVSLNYKVIDTDNLTWDISGNASFLTNKMTKFAPFVLTGELNGQGLSNASAQVITNNQPIYSYYMYEWRGFDASGNSIYADAAGNDTDLGFAAKKLVGKQPLPKMNLGFSTNISYKNFDAAVSFYGSYGHYIYNNTSNALFFKGAYLGGRNVPSAIAASTQVQGDPNAPSTKYLEKGDFLRMGNLTFGYTYSGKILEKARIKSARFFVNGANLLLFTNYTGFDPEVDTDKTFNGVPSAGIDYLSYPRSKSFSFGLNLNF